MFRMLIRDFQAGQIFQGPKWDDEFDRYSSVRTVEGWMQQAMREKTVTLEHTSLVDFGYTNIKFNGKVYGDWEMLRKEKIENYPSSKVITPEIIASMAQAGIIRPALKEELDEIVLNPLHAVNTCEKSQKLGKKPRLILHTKINAVSKKQATNLEGIQSTMFRLLDLEEATVLDARKSFYQIPISESSQKLCGFEIFGQVWVAKVIMFGTTNGTHICDTLLGVPIFNFRRDHAQVASIHYIDDTIVDKEYERSWREALTGCNVELNLGKRISGKVVTFLGLVFHFERRTGGKLYFGCLVNQI